MQYIPVFLIVFGFVFGCTPKKKQVSVVPSEKKTVTKKPASTVKKPVVVATLPAGEALEALVGKLSAQSKAADLAALVDTYIPGFSKGQGATWPRKATVKLLPISQDGTLLGAFVEVSPSGDGLNRLGKKVGEPLVYSLFIRSENTRRTLRLTRTAFETLSTTMFDGTLRTIAFPLDLADVSTEEEKPMAKPKPKSILSFYVKYRFVPQSIEEWEVGANDRNMVEVYALTATDIIRVGKEYYTMDTTIIGSGHSRKVSAKLDWVRGRGGETMYLVATQYHRSRTPRCAGGGSGPGCGVHYSCSKICTVDAIIARGKVLPGKHSLALLHTAEPALRAYPVKAVTSEGRTCENTTF